jgi:hypothetical protein
VRQRLYGLDGEGVIRPTPISVTKNRDHVEVIDIAVGKMQRHFEPMKRRINVWQHMTYRT